MSTEESVLTVLARITELDDVSRNLNLNLFDLHILDSFKTVELMVALEQEFGIEISPAEFEREQWATPARIVKDIEGRINH